MDLSIGRNICRASLLAVLFASSIPFVHAQWTAPTPEELSMTAQPQVPGAPAVYLFREELMEDKLSLFSVYVRIKVLAERGKEFGTVELPSVSGNGMSSTVDEVQGRTIHSDGTITPFTGKPYETMLERSQGIKVAAKVFSLPDVEVGSIIEYRYKMHFSDRTLRTPQWYIQSSLWTRKAHYLWKPLDLSGSVSARTARGEVVNTIFWTKNLPDGVEVKRSSIGTAPTSPQSVLELNVQDIPPSPNEAYMPPISTLTYRVLFYWSSHRSSEEFWHEEGKYWATEKNKFIGPGPVVTAATRDLISNSETQDQKLRKIYAAVMQLENLSFTPQHSGGENAPGPKEVHNTDDVWARKRGTNIQLTELFIAMARAAGMKAYFASVTERDRNIFSKDYLTLGQLNGNLAIVNVDGKEQFFDPGARYCPYGRLVWQNTDASGLRQTESGSDFIRTPPLSYSFSHTQRVANLAIDEHGDVAGTITMTYTGYPNLGWRQTALREGRDYLEQALQRNVENLVPQGVEVKVTSIEKLEDFEQPLVVNLEVKGSLGSLTGRHLTIPCDIFEAKSKSAFPDEKREIPIYFQYPRVNQDAIRIKFPGTLTIESLPTSDRTNFQKFAAYNMATESTGNSFTVRRDYTLGGVYLMPDEYAQLRAFYSKMETKDQESVVLTNAPAPAKPAGN